LLFIIYDELEVSSYKAFKVEARNPDLNHRLRVQDLKFDELGEFSEEYLSVCGYRDVEETDVADHLQREEESPKTVELAF
jgi:hypothetical protein